MTKPVVSVVMITYAHERYIEQAINGVLMQVCDFEVELIITNDCSPDTTDAVIMDIIKTHPKASWIKYIKHDKNIGMMPNFVYTLKEAKGKYIAMCEGDDYWTDPLKLQKQLDFLENNFDYNLITTNALIHKSNGDKVYQQINKNFSFNLKKQMKSNCCVTCSTMFRNNQFDGIENEIFKNLKIGDIVLWALLLRNKKKGYFISENSANYRIHSGGVHSQNTKKDNTINELNVHETLLNCNCFNNSELKSIQYKIQIMWYSLFCNSNWFPQNYSYDNVMKFFNIYNYNSIILVCKCKIKFYFNQIQFIKI